MHERAIDSPCRSTTMAMSPWELEPLVVTLRDPSHLEGLQ